MHPRIALKHTKTFVDYINIALLVIIGVVAMIRYFALPIATDYPNESMSTEPDEHTWLNIIIEPIMALFLYFLFSSLQRRPHWLNYPVKVTKENAPVLYPKMQQFLRFLTTAMLVMAMFSLIFY